MKKASAGQRMGGYLVDFLVTIPLGMIWMIPIIGTLVGGLAMLLYWLLRDIINPSLGKRVSSLRVMSARGGGASTGQLILRNLPLAFPNLILMIPLFGFVLGAALDTMIIVTELVFVLADGRRIGDRLAGTVVMAAD